MSLQDEGTVSFWIRHEHSDWATNDKRYVFGPIASDVGIAFHVVKHPNKTLEISLSGPLGAMQAFMGPMPEAGPKGVYVVMTWKDKETKLYLNGEPVHSGKLPESA